MKKILFFSVILLQSSFIGKIHAATQGISPQPEPSTQQHSNLLGGDEGRPPLTTHPEMSNLQKPTLNDYKGMLLTMKDSMLQQVISGMEMTPDTVKSLQGQVSLAITQFKKGLSTSPMTLEDQTLVNTYLDSTEAVLKDALQEPTSLLRKTIELIRQLILSKEKADAKTIASDQNNNVSSMQTLPIKPASASSSTKADSLTEQVTSAKN